jgi:3',5'-cyclic AMP phosphodiesterase CpdA
MRVVQISDTHMLNTGGAVLKNFEIAADYANGLKPDLIIHTGDAVGLNPDWTHDKEFVVDCFRSTFNAPFHVLPGNHDTGDTGPQVWMNFHATSERVQGHRKAFNGDRFVETFGDWTIIGQNSEMFGSGIPEEHEQWAWLDETLASATGKLVALFEHKPIWRPKGVPAEAIGLSLDGPSRTRLLNRIRRGGHSLRAVGTGHLHLSRGKQRSGAIEGWGPSTSFTTGLPTAEPNKPGIVEWRFGHDTVERIYHQPPGLTALDFTEIPEFVEALALIEREQATAA